MICLSLSLLIGFTAHALSGDKSGNGGDPYSIEFKQVAIEVAGILMQRPIAHVDVNLLLQTIGKTTVSSEDKLTLHGADVGAINHPDATNPTIQISRADWDAMKNESYQKDFLVLHEFLDLMGIDDSKYDVSEQLDQAHICSRSEGVRIAIEANFAGISCDRLQISDLQKVTYLQVGAYPNYFAPLFIAGDFDALVNLSEIDSTLKGDADQLPDHLFDKLPKLTMVGIDILGTIKVLQNNVFETNAKDVSFTVDASHFGTVQAKAFGSHPDGQDYLGLWQLKKVDQRQELTADLSAIQAGTQLRCFPSSFVSTTTQSMVREICNNK